MKQYDLSEMEIEDDIDYFRFRRQGDEAGPVTQPVVVPQMVAAPAQAPQSAPAEASTPGTGVSDETSLVKVTAPMVGTFYTAPSPDADPFVETGEHVTPDTIVCIIEAMKVMNEIKAEVSGIVRKVLVDNARPVEYGQTIFLVEPD
jgi:acetyl-CoA carboxylase biotin carboxyl carrier protein